MLRQLLFGSTVSVANIAIHAFVMTIVVHVVKRTSASNKIGSSTYLVMVMIPTVLVLMVTHTAEVMVWAFGYYIASAAPEGADRLYFAFVNYTTLGYGDVVPLDRWRLLGPMTAMNGILLFGWSTAVIFEVLRKAIAHDGKMTSSK